jgi:hypothetical protein
LKLWEEGKEKEGWGLQFDSIATAKDWFQTHSAS